MFGQGRFANRPYNGLILHGFPFQPRNSDKERERETLFFFNLLRMFLDHRDHTIARLSTHNPTSSLHIAHSDGLHKVPNDRIQKVSSNGLFKVDDPERAT